MKKIAVIQARMLSTRLRGKSLMSVNGVPLLFRVIRSVQQTGLFDRIIVATTRFVADDPIESALKDFAPGVDVFRGDAENVLKRFVDALAPYDERDLVARFTADNPIYNRELTRKMFETHLNAGADYTYVDGLSPLVPEFIHLGALREAHRLTTDDFDREHVTPFLRKNAGMFRVQKLDKNWDRLQARFNRYLTIDTREQLEFIENLLRDLDYDKRLPPVESIYDYVQKHIDADLHTAKGLMLELDGTPVGDGLPAYIVAEIGQNHNGSIEMAKQLIDVAVDAGANAVKFQKRHIPSDLTREAFDKPYDNPNSFGKTYGEHRLALELSEDQHRELQEYARARGITYFLTPTDIPSVDMAERLDVPFYKVASRDLDNIPLLRRIARTGKPVIISTGMASLDDIADALDALGRERSDIIILQCVSQYPAELERANLRAMETLRRKFGKITGYSDHTTGITAAVTASILGAAVIEKHITLNKALKGSDHAASAEPDELARMIRFIREARKTLGDGVKEVDPAVEAARAKLGRSLVSKTAIPAGTVLTENMLVLKSPGTGLRWKERHLIVGKKARHDIPADVTLRPEMFE